MEAALNMFAYMTAVNFVLVALCVALPVLRRVFDPLLSSTYVLLGAFLLVPWRRIRIEAPPDLTCVVSGAGALLVVHGVFHALPLVVAAASYGKAYRVLPAPFLGTTLLVAGHALLFDYDYWYYGNRHRAARYVCRNAATSAEGAMYARGLLVFLIGVALVAAWATFLATTAPLTTSATD